MRWNGIDFLFTSCPKQIQTLCFTEFGIVEFGDGAWIHDVAVFHHTGIFCTDGNFAVFHQTFVQLKPDWCIVQFRVHPFCHFFFWFYNPQRFGNGYLQYQNLVIAHRYFRYTVTGLHNGGILCPSGTRHVGTHFHKFFDIYRIDAFVTALVDDFQGVIRANE